MWHNCSSHGHNIEHNKQIFWALLKGIIGKKLSIIGQGLHVTWHTPAIYRDSTADSVLFLTLDMCCVCRKLKYRMICSYRSDHLLVTFLTIVKTLCCNKKLNTVFTQINTAPFSSLISGCNACYNYGYKHRRFYLSFLFTHQYLPYKSIPYIFL